MNILRTASQEQAQQRANAKGNANGLVGMIANDFIRNFGLRHASVLDFSPGFLAAFQCGSQPFTGFDNFCFRRISSGCEQRLRVVRQVCGTLLDCIIPFHINSIYVLFF
jgi:hypothetical protein